MWNIRNILPILLVVAASACSRNSQPGIKVIGPDNIDFGKYPATEKKIAEYKIRNSGKETLKILKIRKTCGCASVTSDKTELKSGETANINVTILANSIFHKYSKNSFIESNDPDNRFLKLTVAGNAIPLVDIKPNAILHAGRIEENAEWSQVFHLTGEKPDIKLGTLEVKSNHPVETKLIEIDDETGSHYTLNTKMLPVNKSGDFVCLIKIPVLEPSNHPPLNMIISGKIGNELAAIPGMAKLPLSDESQTRNFALRIIGQQSRELEPDELTLPKRDDVSFEVIKGNRDLQIKAIFSSEFSKTLFAEKTITLEFTVPELSSARLICKTLN